jgi:hypothetical protein
MLHDETKEMLRCNITVPLWGTNKLNDPRTVVSMGYDRSVMLVSANICKILIRDVAKGKVVIENFSLLHIRQIVDIQEKNFEVITIKALGQILLTLLRLVENRYTGV